jgi:hypothetical protein
MQKNQSVSEMATEVLARQAGARAKHTGESLEEALRAVLQTEAGRRLGQLRDGDHRDERADEWQPNLPRVRTEEHTRPRLEMASSLVFSNTTISGIKGGLRTCTELVSSGPTKTL